MMIDVALCVQPCLEITKSFMKAVLLFLLLVSHGYFTSDFMFDNFVDVG